MKTMANILVITFWFMIAVAVHESGYKNQQTYLVQQQGQDNVVRN